MCIVWWITLEIVLKTKGVNNSHKLCIYLCQVYGSALSQHEQPAVIKQPLVYLDETNNRSSHQVEPLQLSSCCCLTLATSTIHCLIAAVFPLATSTWLTVSPSPSSPKGTEAFRTLVCVLHFANDNNGMFFGMAEMLGALLQKKQTKTKQRWNDAEGNYGEEK